MDDYRRRQIESLQAESQAIYGRKATWGWLLFIGGGLSVANITGAAGPTNPTLLGIAALIFLAGAYMWWTDGRRLNEIYSRLTDLRPTLAELD